MAKQPKPKSTTQKKGTAHKKGKLQKNRSTTWSPWSKVLDPTPENARKLLKHPDPGVREAAQRYLKSHAALKGS